MSQLQVTGEAKIRDIQGPVVANSGVITALDGAASQYVRGDGTLADFPTSTGGGSSVSYYLNSSVSQGTIGGVAYRQLGKTPITGAGTDIAISSNGYVASYITDANDPSLLEVPAGNFNCEFYFSVNNNTGNPYVYAEIYKYDGTTFTLLGSSVGVPEYITEGTTINPYYFAVPVATSTLGINDRIAIRIYVNVDGRTVTLHTEDNHLCQVVTTFSKGLISLNNLTRQNQFFATGTSGTDFGISSSVATHTFNLPVASATNTGKLSSTDWSTFNNKVPYTGATGNVNLGSYGLTASGVIANNFYGVGNGTQGGYLYLKQGSTPYAGLLGSNAISADGTKILLIANVDSSNNKLALFELGSLTNNTNRTFTLPDASGTLALTSDLNGYVTIGTIQTITGDKTFSGLVKNDAGILLKNGTISYSTAYTSLGGDSGNLIISSSPSGTPYDNELAFTPSTSNTYTFPNASGTIALTSNLSAYLPLSGGIMTGNILLNNNIAILGQIFGTTGYSAMLSMSPSNKVLIDNGGRGVIFGSTIGQGSYTYSFPTASGTLALTSDLNGYVPYNGATTGLDLGIYSYNGNNVIINGNGSTQNGTLLFKQGGALAFNSTGYSGIGILGTTSMYFNFNQSSGVYKQFNFNVLGLTNNTTRTLNIPDATGTIALTSDLGAYLPLTGGTLTGFLTSTKSIAPLDNGQISIIPSTNTSAAMMQVTNIGGTTYFGRNNNSGSFLSSSPNASLIYSTGSSPIMLYTNGNMIMTLTGGTPSVGGNVLINTTSDNGAKLQVSGSATFSSSVTAASGIFSQSAGQSLQVYQTTATNATTAIIRQTGDGGNGNQDIGLLVDIQGANDLDNIANFRYYNGSTYTSRMVIKRGGNVGIGTSSPAGLLSLRAATTDTPTIVFQNASNGPNSAISNYATAGQTLTVIGANFFINSVGSANRFNTSFEGCGILFDSGDIGFNTGTSGMNPTSRMRITSGGDVGIGNSAFASTRLTVSGKDNTSSNYSFVANNASNSNLFLVRNDGLIALSQATYNRSTSATYRTLYIGDDLYLGGVASIRASKKNIETNIDIDWIYQLNPVTFNYRKKDKDGNFTEESYNELNYGLIAEDTSLVADFLCNYDETEETKKLIGIEYSRLITPMLKAIQEQQAQIEELKLEIEQLKNK